MHATDIYSISNKSYDLVMIVKCSICKKTFKSTCIDISSNELRTLSVNKGQEVNAEINERNNRKKIIFVNLRT